MRNTGKFITYVLRHKPSAAYVELDENGCADVGALIDGVCRTGRILDLHALEKIVETNGKHRFDFNSDHTKIRANQGHTIKVNVEMQSLAPPDILYHGTAEKNLESIKKEGILKKSRNYVHLSKDVETAIKVGSRHGKPIVLKIDAKRMYADGFEFLLSANGVWQTKQVPINYVTEIIV